MTGHNLMRKSLEGYFLDEVELRCDPIKDHPLVLAYAPATEFMRCRQKIACLDAILVRERLRHLEKKKEFQERWDAAGNQMKAVDQSIIKFNDHYRDSNNQRDRYFKLVSRQNELKTEKMNENQRLQDEKNFLEEILEQTTHRVESFKPVKEYLEKVRQASRGEFRTIRELLDRANSLTTVRAGLMHRDDTARDLIQRRERMLENLVQIKSNEAVLLNNNIFELMAQHDHLQAEQASLEEDLQHVKNTAAERAMNLGQVRIAIFNLYCKCCVKMGRAAKIPSNDTVKQLEYIQMAMLEMNKLRREVRQILKEAKRNAIREKREAELAEIEAEKRRERMPNLVKAGDMLGLFRIKRKPHNKELDLISLDSPTNISIIPTKPTKS